MCSRTNLFVPFHVFLYHGTDESPQGVAASTTAGNKKSAKVGKKAKRTAEQTGEALEAFTEVKDESELVEKGIVRIFPSSTEAWR